MGRHNVRLHRTGTKRFHHQLVGELTLDYEALELPGDQGQKLVVYTAEPGSASQDALGLLASWTTVTPSEAQPEANTAPSPDTSARARPGGSNVSLG